ncbi:unnamed protein product [Durusdinium trenchii]|uniref:EF-hand domain-containing protein n=1 Tax=Durusdinium trenchii TaxID=1381693 RepID=A0ABP0LVR9_9DINO
MRVEPTVVTYAAVIASCEAGGRWQLALDFLREIRHRKLQGNLVAFNAAVSACEKASQWTWALQILEDVTSFALQPNVITCSAAISAGEKAAEWAPALSVLEDARSHKLRPNLVAYNAFLGACQNAWQWERSLATLATLDADVISLTSAVSASGDASQWPRAAGMFREMHWRQIESDFSFLSATTSAKAVASSWQKAVEMQEILVLMHQTPGIGFFNSLLHACHQGSAWLQSVQLLTEERRFGARPDELGLSAVLLGCVSQRAFRAARRSDQAPCEVGISGEQVKDLLWACRGREFVFSEPLPWAVAVTRAGHGKEPQAAVAKAPGVPPRFNNHHGIKGMNSMTSVLLAVSMEKLEMRLVYSYKASVFEITNMTRMTMQLVKDELGQERPVEPADTTAADVAAQVAAQRIEEPVPPRERRERRASEESEDVVQSLKSTFDKEIFDHHDGDGSGRLSFDEIIKVIETLMEEQVPDEDTVKNRIQSGQTKQFVPHGLFDLNFEDFLVWYSPLERKVLGHRLRSFSVQEKRMRNLAKLNGLDALCMDRVDEEEFENVLREASTTCFFWREIDEDESGKATFVEFLNFWSSRHDEMVLFALMRRFGQSEAQGE